MLAAVGGDTLSDDERVSVIFGDRLTGFVVYDQRLWCGRPARSTLPGAPAAN